MKQLKIRSYLKGMTRIILKHVISFTLETTNLITAIENSGLFFDRPVKKGLTKRPRRSSVCLNADEKSAGYV